jgi:hypothetical protein
MPPLTPRLYCARWPEAITLEVCSLVNGSTRMGLNLGLLEVIGWNARQTVPQIGKVFWSEFTGEQPYQIMIEHGIDADIRHWASQRGISQEQFARWLRVVYAEQGANKATRLVVPEEAKARLKHLPPDQCLNC